MTITHGEVFPTVVLQRFGRNEGRMLLVVARARPDAGQDGVGHPIPEIPAHSMAVAPNGRTAESSEWSGCLFKGSPTLADDMLHLGERPGRGLPLIESELRNTASTKISPR